MAGKVVVVSGPSGVGKTTVCNELLKSPQFARVITATTRKPREGEVDGVDYHFFSHDDFNNKVAQGFFLESAEVFENHYGSPKGAVLELLAKGKSVLLNIDVQGAKALRTSNEVEIATIFLMPPSFSVLEKRLRGRSTDSNEVIEKRLTSSRGEFAQVHLFDHIVINDLVKNTAQRILDIVRGCQEVRPAKIILGVMGSIAAYKAADLTSKLAQDGHEVHVVMTEAASKLVDPNTFLYLSGHRVHIDMFDKSQIGPIEHIALTDDADLIVVAPVTANGLGQLAHGLASNMLCTMLLAAQSPVLLCPAMNPRMWTNPVVQENVKRLIRHGFHMLTPKDGRMACGHTGPGRLVEPEDIVRFINGLLHEQFKASS
jgi:guanylate kinase